MMKKLIKNHLMNLIKKNLDVLTNFKWDYENWKQCES